MSICEHCFSVVILGFLNHQQQLGISKSLAEFGRKNAQEKKTPINHVINIIQWLYQHRPSQKPKTARSLTAQQHTWHGSSSSTSIPSGRHEGTLWQKTFLEKDLKQKKTLKNNSKFSPSFGGNGKRSFPFGERAFFQGAKPEFRGYFSFVLDL